MNENSNSLLWQISSKAFPFSSFTKFRVADDLWFEVPTSYSSNTRIPVTFTNPKLIHHNLAKLDNYVFLSAKLSRTNGSSELIHALRLAIFVMPPLKYLIFNTISDHH